MDRNKPLYEIRGPFIYRSLWNPDPDPLDAAWAAAEAALPRNGWLKLEGPEEDGQYVARAFQGMVEIAVLLGPTPAAALRTLAAKLAGTPSKEEGA